MEWELVRTKSSEFSIKVIKDHEETLYLNSVYNPISEARRWVNGINLELPLPKKMIVVGMGAGYHIKELILKYPDVNIEVWDFNEGYGGWLKEQGFLSQLESIKYIVTEDLTIIKNCFIKSLSEEKVQLIIHRPSLNIIPDKLFEIRDLLNNYSRLTQNIQAKEKILYSNFFQNILLKDEGIKKWVNFFSGQPMVLVSAGPSLTKQLPLLLEIYQSRKILIACVGTALIPLIKAGVTPHFVMVSDPTHLIKEQFKNVELKNSQLFYLSTANFETVAQFPQKRFIVWQKGFTEAENQASIFNEPLVETGGSVATCLLDLLVTMGGGPIALVGQDLSYPTGFSHAENSNNRTGIPNNYKYKVVPDFYQKSFVNTSESLNTYRKWFEQYIEDRGNYNQFWNCTEGGAYIQGWKHSSLLDFFSFVDNSK